MGIIIEEKNRPVTALKYRNLTQTCRLGTNQMRERGNKGILTSGSSKTAYTSSRFTSSFSKCLAGA